MRKWFGLPLILLLKKLPIDVLVKVEDKVQFGMGKGFGAATTTVEAQVVANFAKNRNIKKVIALDVGANVGNWSASIIEAIPTASVVAFEPSNEAYKTLTKRFKNQDAVLCINSALGKTDEKAMLYSDQSASGLASLTKRRVVHFGIDFDYEEEVEIARLDTWIREQQKGFSPNILKMDVEGHEMEVLLGAEETLNAIEIVQFEFGGSNIDTRTFFQDFWYFFKNLGFDVYRITPRGSLLVDTYRESDETFRPTNYVAVRR
jgi:FkbM family methyltransferase